MTFCRFKDFAQVSVKRTEPVVYLAENHHLAIGELVDKYRQYLRRK